jgi:hypothetical protein
MHLALHILRCPGCMIIIELDLEYVIYIAILRGCDCSRRDLQHTTPHTQLLPAQNSPPKIMSRLISLPSMLTTWQSGSTSRQLQERLHVTANSCFISRCWYRCWTLAEEFMSRYTSRGMALSARMMSPSRPRLSRQLTLTYRQDSPCSTTTPELAGAPSGACNASWDVENCPVRL